MRVFIRTILSATVLIILLISWQKENTVSNVFKAPGSIGSQYDFYIKTPDKEIDKAAKLAVKALWDGATYKAGILVPTVSGDEVYRSCNHPYDNFWINKVSFYFFPRISTEWPIRLFAAYQTPLGEIWRGVYAIPEKDWRTTWEKNPRIKPTGQRVYAPPYSEHVSTFARNPEEINYGIYVRDHLFVRQVYEQWLATGNVPFIIEMYRSCRKSLLYLKNYHDKDGNGLIETTTILSDLVVNNDKDINSTERAEDQVMLYGALMGFADMSDILGGKEDSQWAREWAEKIKTGLNNLMWNDDGRYIFGLERVSKKPRLGYVTTTYANGYAILYKMTSKEQTEAILNFMDKQQFDVPGPYHIPPVRLEDNPVSQPGVYCNGGCGWGRGIMPSITQACFENGRIEQGTDYLHRQASAACAAGSFYEYWTWGKYTGKESKPGGAPWYGETSSGYLDALIHGLFGISSLKPGFDSLRIEPRFPGTWDYADLGIHIPSGTRLNLKYKNNSKFLSMRVDMDIKLPVELIFQWKKSSKELKTKINGDITYNVKPKGDGYQITYTLKGSGEVKLYY